MGEATAYLTEGQYEEGFKALIPVAQNIIKGAKPEAAAAVNAAKFAVAHSQRAWTNWKSNRVEELYQIYKNGKDGLFNNEVIAQNEESFLNYLDYGSGFIPGRMIKRFYNMDKVAETCELYGWGPMEYDELPKDKKEEFNRRAQEGLLEYFRTRLAQELEAERIKEDERVCIERMLDGGDGCLNPLRYTVFFGEDSWGDYDITNRLRRLMHIRNNISGFVDIEKLQKDQEYWKKRGESYYNWGDILNSWVSYMYEYMPDKDTAIRKFKERLKSSGYLHPDYMTTLYPTLDQLVGVYTGRMIEKDIVITEMYFFDWFRDKPGEIKKQMDIWNYYLKDTVYYKKLFEITKIDDCHGRISTYLFPGDGNFDFEYSDEDGHIVSIAQAIDDKPIYPHLDLYIGKFDLQASYSGYREIKLDGIYEDILGASGITSYEGENWENFGTLRTHSVHYKKSYSSDD